MPAFVKFWGTRGSIPTPASWTRVYGGNTSCVEVRFDDTIFICDAGSGIREFGKDLLARQPLPTELHLLITHSHWDHIQGFPFFTPAYMKAMQLRVYGKAANDETPCRLLSGQMASEYFPVSFKDLGARIVLDHFENNQKIINGVQVRSFPLNHPGGCNGYMFEKDGRKIVYATDNELDVQPGEQHSSLRIVPRELIDLFRNADLLIMDAQYDEQEYASKKGWGHSSCLSVTDLAIQANVKHLALFHHDPERTDNQIDANVKSCCERVGQHQAQVTVFAAREGIELKF